MPDLIDAWPRNVFTLPWTGRAARESARGGVKATGTELDGEAVTPTRPLFASLRTADLPPPGGGKARLRHGLFVICDSPDMSRRCGLSRRSHPISSVSAAEHERLERQHQGLQPQDE